MPAKKKSTSIQDFENQMNKLNQLIEKMEKGDLPLDDALKCFEEGVALVQSCQNTLTSAEQKIQQITATDD